MIDLLPDERIDDLQCKGHQIIQNPNMFCFGMDAVLLANFVKHRRDGMYMDLGTGTGVIPILLAAKEPSDGTCQFIGLEIQDACAEMAGRSVRLNDLEQKVRIDHGDIREVSCNYRKAFFDIVTSNPPYISGNHGLTNPDEPKNIARHEICVTLSDVIEAAAYLLKPGGRLSVITYHSLEDRIVKNMMKAGNPEGKIEQDFFGRIETPFKLVNNKVIIPDADEQERNPRSRSAKLRIAEKK